MKRPPFSPPESKPYRAIPLDKRESFFILIPVYHIKTEI